MAKILDPDPDTEPNGPAEAPIDPPPSGSEIGRLWVALGGARRWRPGSELERMRGRTGQYQSFLDNQSLHGVLTIVWTPETGAHALTGAIRQAWGGAGAEGSVVGCPTSDEMATHDGVGRFQTFEHGIYVWHADTGAHEVHGAILDRYGQIGGSAFGYPTTDESGTSDGRGRFSHFRNVADGGEASIYWTQETGAHEIYGYIRQSWAGGGWETGPLGYPTSHEDNTHDDAGRFQAFEHGVNVWHPELGAFAVHGPIHDKYRDLHGSWYGYPLHDVATTADGRGHHLHVRVPGSGDRSIYWTPETGAHTVWGAIRDAWGAYGWERGLLGYPTMDEDVCQPGDGAFQAFEHGMFVWHASTGAHEVHGDIYARYQALGGSHFGYPTTDEGDAKGDGRFNHFLEVATGEQRSIYWTPDLGAIPVTGAIRQCWERLGWEHGHLGFPTADAQPWAGAPMGEAGALSQAFQGGSQILATPSRGAVADPMQWLHELPKAGIEGHVDATIRYSGDVRFHAYVKGSSWQGYDYVLQSLLKARNNMAAAFSRKSKVSSTHAGDDRNHHTDEFLSVVVRDNYWEFANGSLLVTEEHSGQVTGVIGDLVEGICKFAVGSIALANPGSALLLVAGTELAGLISGGGLGAGARLIDGTLFLAGPNGTVFAILADGLAALATDTRTLRPEEYDFAEKVFRRTLPPRDDILVSDAKGVGGKAFTYPRFDNKVIINVGDGWKSDLRDLSTEDSPEYGQFLIHELVHVWQFHNNDAAISYATESLYTKVFDDDYEPGVELTEDWDDYGLEEQAVLVDRWYARHYQGPGHRRADPARPGHLLPTLTAAEDFGLLSPAAITDMVFQKYLGPHVHLGNN